MKFESWERKGFEGDLFLSLCSGSQKVRRALVVRWIKAFLEIMVLYHFRAGSFSGYDVIKLVRKRFSIALSAGTVYSVLHVMEREQLILGRRLGGKVVYRVTEKGLLFLEISLLETQQYNHS